MEATFTVTQMMKTLLCTNSGQWIAHTQIKPTSIALSHTLPTYIYAQKLLHGLVHINLPVGDFEE